MGVPEIERKLGIEVYATKTPGIEGRIKQLPEDFVVEEILTDGSKAEASFKSGPPSPPSGEGEYLICVLVKRCWANLLALKEIAKGVGVSFKHISIAGIKDAKALTAQYVSIRGITFERSLRLNVKDMMLYPIRYSKEGISARRLLGNRFNIIIRNIPYPSSEVTRRANAIEEELDELGGILNFFGHQRFGTIRPLTHLVGRALVKGDVEQAAMIYLADPSPFESQAAREARELLLRTGDVRQVLRMFPRHLKHERAMLNHLVKSPGDYVGALRRLPLRLRKLFTQAYQSYLFNKFLSRRALSGIPLNEPQVGDYLIALGPDGLPIGRGIRVDELNVERARKAVKEGRATAALPLVGFKQPPSEGIQGEVERSILDQEGVSPKDFLLKALPEASAPGGLRTALAPVLNFHIDGPYEDPMNPLTTLLRVSFELRRGCYATALLRELMKPYDLIKAGF